MENLEEFQNIEMVENGLKCDNPNCDWTDTSISFSNYTDWIDKPCPKCGENVLTEQDYFNALLVRLAANVINNLSPEDISEIAKKINIEDLKNSPIFSDAIGFENLSNEKQVQIFLNTHKEIKVTEIKSCEPEGGH